MSVSTAKASVMPYQIGMSRSIISSAMIGMKVSPQSKGCVVLNVDYTQHNWLVFKYAQKWLSEWAGHIRGTVYDFGCGERPYEDFILQHADRYIGVDWSNTLHDLKAEIVADLNQPLSMIADESGDTIFSVSVMEHLCEPQNLLNESFRILKPGGGNTVAGAFSMACP